MTIFATHTPTGLREFRLDIVDGPDPDAIDTSVYFEAAVDQADVHARRLLADHDGPDDRYGELWIRDSGSDAADHWETIHLG